MGGSAQGELGRGELAIYNVVAVSDSQYGEILFFFFGFSGYKK